MARPNKYLQLIAMSPLLLSCKSVIDYKFSVRVYDIERVDQYGTRRMGVSEDAILWIGPEISIDYEFYYLEK